MSEPETQNVVLRCPSDLLARIDAFTAARGGSRHSVILYLLNLGIGSDAEITRRVEIVKHRLGTKLDRVKTDVLETS